MYATERSCKTFVCPRIRRGGPVSARLKSQSKRRPLSSPQCCHHERSEAESKDLQASFFVGINVSSYRRPRNPGLKGPGEVGRGGSGQRFVLTSDLDRMHQLSERSMVPFQGEKEPKSPGGNNSPVLPVGLSGAETGFLLALNAPVAFAERSARRKSRSSQVQSLILFHNESSSNPCSSAPSLRRDSLVQRGSPSATPRSIRKHNSRHQHQLSVAS